ncbi:hypothetical protein [Delftia deserti]|uniref:Uncharacterized protein n=1 Tax=Delftia deserti TaxID=1651218 RepID=A0ABW5EXH1_9BURK
MKQVHSAGGDAGIVYTLEILRRGQVIDREVVHNLMPEEGRNHGVSVMLKGATQAATWYIGLFEGNYVPVDSDKAATFPTLATECTAYAPATRVAFTSGAVAAGTTDNTASRAEFTFTSAKTVYGAFLTSAQAKGAVTGVLLSAARFTQPKALQVDDVLRVTASFSLQSA